MNPVEQQILEEARQKALEILYRTLTPNGFRASAGFSGYPQVWARDSMIVFLGAMSTGEARFLDAGRAALDALGAAQYQSGLIPLNVNIESGYVSTENAGAVDSNLWFLLGHCLHFQSTEDRSYLLANWSRIQKATFWLRYQDMNECGLLEIPEAGNWMDLLAVRYNTLYDNVLYYAASLACIDLARRVGLEGTLPLDTNPASIHERLNLLLWIDRCWVAEHFAEHLEKLKNIRLEWFMLYHNIGTISSRPYYLPWVAFRDYGDYCDSLGNLLAILTGVADGHRSEHILRYMYQVGMAEPYPTKAIHPPIYPGESHWREYYRSRNLNLPHQYHNGGIWPFIGGFHIAALIRRGWQKEAEKLLLSLAECNRQGVRDVWEFNEWMHGASGHPMGYPHQAWSAAMFLYADRAVRTGQLPLFDHILALKPDRLVAEEINEINTQPGGGPVEPPVSNRPS